VGRGLAVILTALVGGAVAMQAPINSRLGKSVGTFQAAFFSFAIGTVALFMIASLASGSLGGLRHVRSVPWYYLTGGLLGVCYVSTVLVTVRTLGAGGVTAATLAAGVFLVVRR
jgi:bacterial/archaeal transporter family-2 protein